MVYHGQTTEDQTIFNQVFVKSHHGQPWSGNGPTMVYANDLRPWSTMVQMIDFFHDGLLMVEIMKIIMVNHSI